MTPVVMRRACSLLEELLLLQAFRFGTYLFGNGSNGLLISSRCGMYLLVSSKQEP